MPITPSIMPAINASLAAMQTTLTNAVNAARDNVKADNVTQVTAQTTSLATTVNAARDNVKADNVTQITAQTAAINSNVDSDIAAVTAAVNAKGVVKTKQTITWSSASSQVIIAAVVPAKTVLVIDSYYQQGGTGTSARATLSSATTVDVQASHAGSIQVVEYF